MRIKKHKNNNEYILSSGGHWVRNFTKPDVMPVDINHLTGLSDFGLLLGNQSTNTIRQIARIDLESIHHPHMVIVSDGHGFMEKQELLGKLPSDVAIVAVNGALSKWRLIGKNPVLRAINYFVVNNPYNECMAMLPRKHRYFPKCLASIRTNPDFMKLYQGVTYHYTPTPEEDYSGGRTEAIYKIDDYRNPVCAAIGLAYRFGVEKLLLFCCDDAYSDERPGAERMPNGMWVYPAQQACHGLVDANLYWLGKQQGFETSVGVHSDGPVYKHAAYISEEDVVGFFADD